MKNSMNQELEVQYKKWPFVVLCGYSYKNQRGLELKIILSIENNEEPKKLTLQENVIGRLEKRLISSLKQLC